MAEVKYKKSKLEHPNNSLSSLDLSRNFSGLFVDLQGKNIEECDDFENFEVEAEFLFSQHFDDN